ncbi:uncharacterized protein LOC132400082 [Hypanus sabinus]|uniref:uncharacterized protein LOC132400082 n=1 Tax=Hypanus sabinus TaxID=79690 RepID=UPI0028C3E5D7|nr:uncharacterized protein LOC132400082 [Hypanus sabinus]
MDDRRGAWAAEVPRLRLQSRLQAICNNTLERRKRDARCKLPRPPLTQLSPQGNIAKTTSSNTCRLKINPDNVAAQPTLALFQSPPIQTVHVGDRAILNCSRDLGVLPYIHWYKRSDQRHLQFVSRVGKFEETKGRFSGQVDEKSATYSLVIEKVQQNDSGIYFCVDQFHGDFGNGSKLVVTAQSPTIFLLAPQEDQIAEKQLVTLMCLVRGVSSHSLRIRWNVSGNTTEGRVDPPIFDPDGGYSVRSRFQIPAESWQSGTVCSCATGHLVSDSVSAQKGSLQLQLCHVLSIGLAATLVFLAAGATTVAIRKYRKEHKPVKGETADKSTTTLRKNRERDIYAQLAIDTN